MMLSHCACFKMEFSWCQPVSLEHVIEKCPTDFWKVSDESCVAISGMKESGSYALVLSLDLKECNGCAL